MKYILLIIIIISTGHVSISKTRPKEFELKVLDYVVKMIFNKNTSNTMYQRWQDYKKKNEVFYDNSSSYIVSSQIVGNPIWHYHKIIDDDVYIEKDSVSINIKFDTILNYKINSLKYKNLKVEERKIALEEAFIINVYKKYKIGNNYYIYVKIIDTTFKHDILYFNDNPMPMIFRLDKEGNIINFDCTIYGDS